jgi:cytochrome c-type biogenesis protein CcmE
LGFKRGYVVLAALLVAAGGATAVFGQRSPAVIYVRSVDELFGAKQLPSGAVLRAAGTLVPGSMTRRDEPCQYRFKLAGLSHELPVVYDRCVVPDSFCERPGRQVPIDLEGALDDLGTFHATLILVRCGGKAEFRTLPDGGLVVVPNEACRCGKDASP